MTQQKFLILLGGRLSPTARLARQISGARVLAADSGIAHAEALDVTPELWLGDFDSADAGLLERFAPVPKKGFPSEKDITDGELAAVHALKHDAEELVLAGAFGGRADHAFLHLTLALRLAEGGTSVILSSGAEEGRPVLPGEADFDLPSGATFSILAFSPLKGLTISGARWPLTRAAVPFGASLTLSNRVEGALRIGLEEGRAVLVAQIEGDH
ncbi:MAG TPA: thiamine diphosphokinase [Mesorhizobium sp.]|jgi:thiamine pyrophosphokinase|nr:thiamine diphosphokinase [Mesorhizobium sp.]